MYNIIFKKIFLYFFFCYGCCLIYYLNLSNNNIDSIAYIEIPSIDLKKEIIYGMNPSNLDKNLITMHSNAENLDENNVHFILAGHASIHVFGYLSHVQINDSIFIVTKEDKYEYIVTDKNIVSKDYTLPIQTNLSYRYLTLITCTKDSKRRILIFAKEK